MLKQKKNILAELKKAGFSSSKIRQEKIMGERELQKMRSDGLPSLGALNKICALLNCQPGDLLEFVPDPVEAPKNAEAAAEETEN